MLYEKSWLLYERSLFGSVITVAFQNVFCVEINQNNFFYF